MCWSYARALILHRETYIPTRFQRQPTALVQCHVLRAHPKQTSPGRGLLRIDYQIVDHLIELALVCLHRTEPIRHLKLAGEVGSAQRELDRVSQQSRQIERLPYRLPALGEGQQLLRQVACPNGRVLRGLQALGDPGRQAPVHRGKGNVPQNAGEYIVEIVRDAPGENTQGLEPLHLLEFSLHLLPFGNIHHDGPHADGCAAVDDGAGVDHDWECGTIPSQGGVLAAPERLSPQDTVEPLLDILDIFRHQHLEDTQPCTQVFVAVAKCLQPVRVHKAQ